MADRPIEYESYDDRISYPGDDMSATTDVRRWAAAGWIAGATFGFGLASFGWWNPYLSLSVLLMSFVFVAVFRAAAAGAEGDTDA